MNSLRVLVVIPCYNEQNSIAAVVNDIHRVKTHFGLSLDILVVNDCSTDGTMAVVKALDCHHLDLPVNLGIGGCMQAGYKYAFRKGYDVAVQVDGDGQHPADGLMALLKPLFEDRADVVIGSRFLERKGFQSSFVRRIGIRYFRWLNQLLIRKTVYDSTSGFRAFNRKTIAIVNQYYPDEYPEPEAIVQFGLHQLRLLEVPVTMEQRYSGTSSITFIRSVYYLFKVTLGTLFIYIRLRKHSL